MVPRILQTFIEQSPIAVMAQAVVANLFDPDRLAALFARTAQRQDQRTLLFSAVVDLMHRVVLGIEPSVYAAYRNGRHALPVSDQAVYDKLDGLNARCSTTCWPRSKRTTSGLPIGRSAR